MTREEDVSKVLCDSGMRTIHYDLQPTYEVFAIVHIRDRKSKREGDVSDVESDSGKRAFTV